MTRHSLNVLLSQFGITPLFHVQFCYFLACIQVAQEAGQMAWYSQLLKNFPQFVVIHMLKGFNIVSEVEVDVFWNSFAFSMIQQMLAI